jgi:HEAT repeat protein
MFGKDKRIRLIIFIFGFFFILSCAEKSKRVNLNEAVQKQDVNTLVMVIKNPKTPMDRNNAIRALARIRGENAVEPLIALLKDENTYVRSAAAEALGEIGDVRAVRPLLFAARYPALRLTRPEIVAIQKIGNPAVDILIGELNNEDPVIRRWSAVALNWIGDGRAVDPIISALKKETDPQAQESMLDRLLAWKVPKVAEDPRMVDVCIALLGAENPKVRERAAKLILDSPDSKAEAARPDAQIVLLNSDNSELRLQAAKSLMQSDDPKAKAVQEQAATILEAEAYIAEKIIYDQFGRPDYVTLYNTDGKAVAEKRFKFHTFNDRLISKEILSYTLERRVTTEADYDNYGRKLNPKFICLDRKGNIVRKGGQAVFVDYFKAQQKQDSKFSYKPFTRIISFSETKIYPCQNCSSVTGIKECAYVW